MNLDQKNHARKNSRDARRMLDSFEDTTSVDADSGTALLGAAVSSIEAAVRQHVGGEWNSPEWVAQRLLADAARILDLVAHGDREQGGQPNRRTAEIIARRYARVV